jgi:hypothetical protein
VQANGGVAPLPDSYLFPRPLLLPDSAPCVFVSPSTARSPFLLYGLHLLPTLYVGSLFTHLRFCSLLLLLWRVCGMR